MPKARKLDQVLAATREVLKPICELVKGSGVVGLEGPANLVLAILTQIKQAKDNDSACGELAARAERLANELKAVHGSITANTTPANLPSVLLRSTELQSRIKTLEKHLKDIQDKGAKLQKASGKRKFLTAGPNAELLKEMTESIQHAIDDFMLRGNLNIEGLLNELLKKAENDASEEKRRELDNLLCRLRCADGGYTSSVHDRHKHFLAGTRSDLLQRLVTWATEDAAVDGHRPFYVLSGGAGTGKSTLAYELAKRVAERGHLGASFFFVREAASLNTPELFFPTIARQLIANIPAVRDHAAAVLKDHPEGNQNLDVQSRDLFAKLLSKVPADHHPIVIIIDAVDECTVEAQDLVQRMLYLMMGGLSIACSRALRIFVTSRPEVHVERALSSLTFGSLQRFSLHSLHKVPDVDGELSDVDRDIERYLEHAFSHELSHAARVALLREYPSATKDLRIQSAGLFIYAATIVLFLRRFIDEEILQGASLLFPEDPEDPKAVKPALTRLANLYTVVLDRAFPDDIRDVQDHTTSMKTVLGFIAVLRDHVNPRGLAELAGMNPKFLSAALRRLAPVISFDPGSTEVLIRPLHASFAEFLVDRDRASRFWVDARRQHQVVAERSLVLLMQGRLLSGFLDHLKAAQSPAESTFSAVRYACLHWPMHVARLCADNSDSAATLVAGMLREFCSSSNFVAWMEILAHLAHLHVAAEYLSTIRNLLVTCHNDRSLVEVLNDCYRLTVEFTPAIIADPRQLVISALPQCRATSSLLQSSTSATSVLRTIFPRRDWSRWTEVEVGTPPPPEDLHECLVFPAPNGKWFAVYTPYQAGDVHLCDARTARALRTLHCHVGEICDLDISPNSKLLVTVSRDGEVHITDSRSGSRLYQLSGLSGIYCACYVTMFSGDSAILLAETTGHFRLWKFSTEPSEVQELTGTVDKIHTYGQMPTRVRSGNGSPSRVMIEGHGAVISVDIHRDTVKTLRLPRYGSVHFLGPDHALICYRDDDSSVLETYRLTNSDLVLLQSENVPFSVYLKNTSLDGRLVVLSADDLMYVWNPTTGFSESQLLGHFDSNHIFSVSPDGRYVYAVAWPNNLCRIIDVHDIRFAARDIVPAYRRRSLSVSADSSTVAVAEVAGDQVVIAAYRVSDGAETFQVSRISDTFQSASLSADGKLLVLCCIGEIQLWDRDRCIGVFRDPHASLPRVLEFRAGTVSLDGTCVIGVGFIDKLLSEYTSTIVWSVDGATAPLVIDARWEWGFMYDIESMHVDASQDIYLVCRDIKDSEYRKAAFVLDYRSWSTAPDPSTPTEICIRGTTRIANERFTLQRDGWVTRYDGGSGVGERLCWIPPSRRSEDDIIFHGHVLPLLSNSGEVSVVDLSAFEEDIV